MRCPALSKIQRYCFPIPSKLKTLSASTSSSKGPPTIKRPSPRSIVSKSTSAGEEGHELEAEDIFEDFERIGDAFHAFADGVVSEGVEKKEGWRSQRQMLRGSEEVNVDTVGVEETYRLMLERCRLRHGRSRGRGVSERSVQKGIRIPSEVGYHRGQETPQSLRNQQKHTHFEFRWICHGGIYVTSSPEPSRRRSLISSYPWC